MSKKLASIFHKSAGTSNVDWDNSGSDTRVDSVPQSYSGQEKRRGNIRMDGPVQPVNKIDPRYKQELLNKIPTSPRNRGDKDFA